MTTGCLLLSRKVVAVSGEEAETFLQGLVTQDVSGMERGTTRYGALLTPQGKIIIDFLFGTDGSTFYLDCPVSTAEAFVKKLALYKLRADVTIEILPVAIAAAWGSEAPGQGWIADPRLPDLGWRSYAPKEIFAEHMPDLKTDSEEDYANLLLKHGVPEFDREFDSEQMFPMDVNMDALNGIDYTKGCFVGQEVASRMKRKGEIRKRVYTFEADSTVEVGASIKAGTTTVATVLSVQGNQGFCLARLDRLEKAGDETLVCADSKTKLIKPSYLR